MNNWIWYLGLTIISILITVFTLWKRKNSKLVPFYFVLSGIIFIFEYTIFVLFESYDYYPKVLENAYFDNVLGAIVSDLFSVPSAAFAIAAFQLNFIWILLISAVFLGIETIFVSLNIYNHNWWNIIDTGLGLLILFSIGKRFWRSLLHSPPKRYIRVLTLYFDYLTLHALFAFILVALLNQFYFHVGWVSNPTRDHTVFNMVYNISIACIPALTVGLQLKWIYNGIGMLCIYLLDWILLKINILHFASSFSLNKFFIVHLLSLILIILFNNILLGHYSQKNNNRLPTPKKW